MSVPRQWVDLLSNEHDGAPRMKDIYHVQRDVNDTQHFCSPDAGRS